MRKVALVLTLMTLSVALAQDADPTKPSTWFLSAAGWGGIVVMIVGFLKTNVIPTHGFGTVLMSLITAVGGAFLAASGWLNVLGIPTLEGTTAEVLTFGLLAFATASGGRDATVSTIRAARQ